jgi:hypothetical protein
MFEIVRALGFNGGSISAQTCNASACVTRLCPYFTITASSNASLSNSPGARLDRKECLGQRLRGHKGKECQGLLHDWLESTHMLGKFEL